MKRIFVVLMILMSVLIPLSTFAGSGDLMTLAELDDRNFRMLGEDVTSQEAIINGMAIEAAKLHEQWFSGSTTIP